MWMFRLNVDLLCKIIAILNKWCWAKIAQFHTIENENFTVSFTFDTHAWDGLPSFLHRLWTTLIYLSTKTLFIYFHCVPKWTVHKSKSDISTCKLHGISEFRNFAQNLFTFFLVNFHFHTRKFIYFILNLFSFSILVGTVRGKQCTDRRC